MSKWEGTVESTTAIAAKTNLNGDMNAINSVFGNFVFRSLYMNSMLSIFCVLSFPLWFTNAFAYDNDPVLINTHILAAFSIFIIFIASVTGFILGICRFLSKEIPFNNACENIAITLYIIGALVYFVAGCHLAQFYNNLGHLLNRDLSAFGGIWWTEMFYIHMISILIGIDLYKQFLNRMDYRIYALFTLYIFCAMTLMCSYLIIGSIAIGVCYLFGFVISCMFTLVFIVSLVITQEYAIKPRLEAIKPKFDLICAILLSIFMLYSVFAYCSTERVRPQETVYYVGYALLILFMAIIMTCDMRFSLYITTYINPQNDTMDT